MVWTIAVIAFVEPSGGSYRWRENTAIAPIAAAALRCGPRKRMSEIARPSRFARARELLSGGAVDTIMQQDTLAQTVASYARPDIHVGPEEAESPTIEYAPGIFVRYVSFDVRNNIFTHVTSAPNGGLIGRHRHRGSVDALTLEGSWRYREYDWVARPGSFIHESPGAIHTLEAHPGMKTLFIIQSALEFFDDNDRLAVTIDVFWAIDHYLAYCREHGLPINEKLFV
jgi:quercetin dioxygenase-like cupin family protein